VLRAFGKRPEDVKRLISQGATVARLDEQVLHLCQRSKGNPNELGKLARPAARETFGQIATDGSRCRAHLPAESEISGYVRSGS
jgi:hypothetical protein